MYSLGAENLVHIAREEAGKGTRVRDDEGRREEQDGRVIEERRWRKRESHGMEVNEVECWQRIISMTSKGVVISLPLLLTLL